MKKARLRATLGRTLEFRSGSSEGRPFLHSHNLLPKFAKVRVGQRHRFDFLLVA